MHELEVINIDDSSDDEIEYLGSTPGARLEKQPRRPADSARRQTKRLHPSGVAGPSTPLKRVTSTSIIDLISDGENVESVPPTPKRSRHLSTPTDSEEEYAHNFPALDPHHASNWQSRCHTLPEHKQIIAEAGCPSFDGLFVSALREQPAHSSGNRWGAKRAAVTTNPPSQRGRYIWDVFAKLGTPSKPKLQSFGYPTRKARDTDPCDRYRSLSQVVSYRQAPGAANEIRQGNGLVVICTSATGGGPDCDDEQPDPYNRSGSLIVYHGDRFHTLQGHHGQRPILGGEAGEFYTKYYSVNEVAIDPTCPTRIISAGCDSTVRMWKIQDTPEKNSSASKENTAFHDNELSGPIALPESTAYFDQVCDKLMYKPDSSVLAVGCADGMVYLYADTDALYDNTSSKFVVAPDKEEHSTGPMTWGLERTSQLLFASSETLGHDHSGRHFAFDVGSERVIHTFNAPDAGEAVAIDSTGQRLALLTVGTAHLLSIFDANGRSPDVVQQTSLEDSLLSVPWDVNAASYSPDGLYLVVSRSDNIAHVYDSRMLLRGPLHSLEHLGPRRNQPGVDTYGIQGAQWVETHTRRKLGLITGGVDGCIRMWDISKSTDGPENGIVIAQLDYDVAALSLGDMHRQEQTLVVGDGGNSIAIFSHRL